MKVHKSITTERLMRAVERSMMDLVSPGFCRACGDETNGVEPDARNYPCRACGAQQVFGAEELMLTGGATQ